MSETYPDGYILDIMTEEKGLLATLDGPYGTLEVKLRPDGVVPDVQRCAGDRSLGRRPRASCWRCCTVG